MHHAILNESAQRPSPLPVTTIRFIANAAGGLLPSLAAALKVSLSDYITEIKIFDYF